MRILLVKTSSMGDILHTLPALSDAMAAFPEIQFDWVIESEFADIPRWHGAVHRVIEIEFRKWRRELWHQKHLRAWKEAYGALRETRYDYVLDAQGLLKSALLSMFARGLRVGLDFKSARERWAALFYQKRCTVNFYQHAVTRMRLLFSLALGYPLPSTAPDFKLDVSSLKRKTEAPYLVFLHSTTWQTKQWPEKYWQALLAIANHHGYRVKIGGGNPDELTRAARIAQGGESVEVLPRFSIQETAVLLANASGVVAVDTGFGHLASALGRPIVSIYGATNPEWTGAIGDHSAHLKTTFACSPCLKRDCTYRGSSLLRPACYAELTPEIVWYQLMRLMDHVAC